MIEPGTLLQNRYRVTKQIGQGGMGAVYVATDERFGSTVAVKQTFFDDPALRKAFEREAHLLNHLRHAALPKVSDHFTEDAGQFLVMEFIPGFDLSELLRQRGGAFPLADVLQWADQLLEALDYLHTHEPPVVHRDIKPQNLKRTPRGQIVLLDFGLAKGTPAQTPPSATASVFGYSRNYAPLEQIQGTGTDARSDLYSLGATLYHLLTGVAPIDALTRAAAIINDQPDPLRPAHLAHAQVPAGVGETLRRAMAQNPALRLTTAAEMRAALRASANNKAVSSDAHTVPAMPVFKQGQPAPDATILWGLAAPSADGQQSITRLKATTHRPATSRGETTLVDAAHGAPRRTARAYAAPVSHELPVEPSRKSPVRIFVVAALVVACAVAAFTFTRRSGARPVVSGAQTETLHGAATDAGTNAPAATQPEALGETRTPISAAETAAPSSSQLQATRAAGEAPTTGPAPGETRGAGASDASAGGRSAGSVEAERASPAEGAAGRPTLVIHSPAPSPLPAEANAVSEEDLRRAEEFRRRQMRPPPPRPEDEDFPPPDDARRPPPRRPPPHRP